LRIAALAFGVVAGLVASLILALGGLDAAELRYLDGRQMQLVTFGLFVIANLGVLGAGLVLAVPLAGAILFVVGAIGWIVAAVAMHHGPDYVMLTPPAILILAAVLSTVAFIRRRTTDAEENFGRRAAVAALRDAGEDEESEDEQGGSGVAVGASFFGDAGTATPLRGAMPPATDPRRDNWEPVRRRVEPPRQKPMFRSVDDDYDDDEESGVSRVARGISSVLSFGLYATLAAAAVLIFWNLRSGDMLHNTATKIEASTSLAPKSAPVLTPPSSTVQPTVVAEAPIAPTLSPTPTASASPELTAPTPPQLSGPSRLAVPAAGAVSSAVAATPTPGPAPVRTASTEARPLPAGVVVAEASPPSADAASSETASAASAEPQPADDLAGSGDAGPLMPYPMPPEIAAGRPTAKPRPTPSAPAPRADTGL